MRKRLSALLVSAALAAGVASAPAAADAQGLQCAQFARLFTGIQIFGNAATWWGQAVGKYARGFTPESGSVLVFKSSGIMRDGHVAVVSHVLTDRIIQVTHANWSVIGGHRGQVEKDVTVVDVSPDGDWSQVKVWYDPSHNLGNTVYPTYGFIYQAARKAASAATQIAVAATAHFAPALRAQPITVASAAPAPAANGASEDLLDSLIRQH